MLQTTQRRHIILRDSIMSVSLVAQSTRGFLLRFVITWMGRALCKRERLSASMMSGFLPSAEIRNTGLVDANVGLQISSSGVDGRDTRPVYASCRLQSSEATVKEPPEPTPIILKSLAPAIAFFTRWISVLSARSYVVSSLSSSISYFVRVICLPDRLSMYWMLKTTYSAAVSRSLCDSFHPLFLTRPVVP